MIFEAGLRNSIRREKREYLVLNPEEFYATTKNPILPQRHVDHLRKSRRLRGEIPLTLSDGCGHFRNAILGLQNELNSLAEIGSIYPREVQTILVQAQIRDKNAEWLLQKVTELGVDKIIFFQGDFSAERGLNPRRAGLIVENAMMQSLNFFRPQIELGQKKLGQYDFPAGSVLFYGEIDSVILPKPEAQLKPSPLIFINGPEGGFSPREKSWLSEHANPLRLSAQVLRSETAAVCAVYYLKALTL